MRLTANHWHLGYCVFASFIAFSPITGVVFPEFSLYFVAFGYSGGPGLAHIWDSLTGLFLGWFRPVSFTLAPFFLGIDLQNPPSVIVFNVVFFALAAYLLPTLLIPKAQLSVRIFVSSFILSAPALQSISYFAVIDSLYIIFAALTIAFFDKAFREQGRTQFLFYLASAFLLVLTATSKEIGVLTSFIAATVIFFRLIATGEETPSLRSIFRVLKFSAPLMLISVLYYISYISLRGAFVTIDSYSSIPALERIGGIFDFITLSLNLNLQFNERWWVRWATANYDHVADVTRLGIYGIVLGLSILYILARGIWPALAFLAVLCTIAVPLGFLLVHPHHVYPMVAALALGIGGLFSFTGRWLAGREGVGGKYLHVLLHVLLIGVSVLLMVRAHDFNRQVYTAGIHGAQLSYNTQLFYDSEFRAKLEERPTYLLIEACPDNWAVGAGVGVLQYYGRAQNGLGEEYVPLGELDTAAKRRAAVQDSEGQLLALECDRVSLRTYSIRDFSGLVAGPMDSVLNDREYHVDLQ